MNDFYKVLKKVTLIFLSCFLVPSEIIAQSASFCYRGEWSPWFHMFYVGNTERYNDGSGFILKNFGGTAFFVFRINNYVSPSKAEIKAHQKSGEWFEYQGNVEYYVSDDYPTAMDVAKNSDFVVPDARWDKTPRVKRYASALIKVAPYKKAPYCYNIWFDGAGVGLSFKDMKFGNIKLK